MTNPIPLTHSTGGGELDPTRHHILADGTGWSQWTAVSGRRPGGAPYPMPTRYGWGTPSCGQPPPWTGDVGNRDSCSREGGHDGPHAAITTDGRGAYSEWGLTPADRYRPEGSTPTPEPMSGTTMRTTSGSELLPTRHYVMPDGTGWGQLRGNTGTYSRPTAYPDRRLGRDVCGQEPPWAGLDPRPANNTRCDRRRGHDGPHVAHSPIAPRSALAEWGLPALRWTRVGYIEGSDVYVGTPAPASSESPVQPAQVEAPRRTTSSGGGDISDPSRFYVMPDGTGWGQVPGSPRYERMASAYLATGAERECRQEPPWSHESPRPANIDRCHRPDGHDGPHACVDGDGMAYAEWNLPAPGTVVTPPSNLTHTTWGEPIPAWCAVTPTSWDSDGVSIGVPRDHRPAYGNCGSEFTEWECTRPEGHDGAHFVGGADNARCYAEWGVHPRTQTSHPTRADNAATTPTRVRIQPRPTHTTWGAPVPGMATRSEVGWYIMAERGLEAPPGLVVAGPLVPCGDMSPLNGGWDCTLPSGHSGSHAHVEGGRCNAEWMNESESDTPAPTCQPVTHTSWGAALPSDARILPDGDGWVVGDEYPIMPRDVYTRRHRGAGARCDEATPRPGITWHCSLTPGHNGNHIAMAGTECCAEWGMGNATTAAAPVTPAVPQNVTHTTWGARLPDGALTTPTSWSVDEDDAIVVPSGSVPDDYEDGGCGRTTTRQAGGTWSCTLPVGHGGPHFAYYDSYDEDDDVMCVAEWGIEAPTTPAPATPQNVTRTSWGGPLPRNAIVTPTSWVTSAERGPHARSTREVRDSLNTDVGGCRDDIPRAGGRDVWRCTRPRGHDGHHIATDYAYTVYAEWGMPPAVPETPPEGYISIEAVRRETRRLAIREGWCPQHHEPLRELGIEPLGQKFTGTITVTIPVTYEVIASMSRNPRDTISGVAEVMSRSAIRRRLDEAVRAARLVTGEGDRYARVTAGGITNVTVGEFTYVED